MPRSSNPDGIVVAQLAGASGYVLAHRLPRDEAIARLHAISTRADLLAQAAGIIAGASTQGMCHRPTEMARARVLVEAGADRHLLPRWIKAGIENAGRRRGRWGEKHAVFEAPQELVDQTLAELLEGLDGDSETPRSG